MWKKWVMILVILIVLWVGWYFWYLFIQNGWFSQKDTKIIKNELLNIQIDNEEIDLSDNTGEEMHVIESIDYDKEAQMEVLRKRFSLRWTIARWDNYSVWNQPILALNEYIKALRQSPNDEQIIKKLAWVYFDLKRYKNSGNTYKEVLPSLTYQEKEKYILTLLYTTDFKNAQEIKTITHEIKNIWISKEDIFYYINSVNCAISFHECKKNFETYFKNFPSITSEKLKNVQKALTNYQNFQIDNLYYKDALLIWALFQDKLYTISNFLSANMLIEKPDYQPILLIIWKWYYELGDLENAKKYLENYYSLDPKELNITYILWDINFRLKDYLTSNLYFNSALKNGFEPKIELQRKLAYNYYLSGDKRSMLNVFWYLVEEKNASIDDFSLWIYHAILEWRNSNAINWANRWIEKFKNIEWYEIFYWYLGWIYREEKNFEKAWEYLKKWLEINGKNPLITLNLGYLEEWLEKYNIALVYFKRTINLNGDWEFWELAKAEMIEIEKYLKVIE